MTDIQDSFDKKDYGKHKPMPDFEQIDENALKEASKKLRKLRLTTITHLKDDGLTPCETVKSVFKAGLGGMYDDEAITYMLRFGIKYYIQAIDTFTNNLKEKGII